MRLPTLLAALALLVPAYAPALAQAQAWQPYSYSDQGLAFALPARPVVDDGKTETWNGHAAPVRTYAAEAPGIVYTLSIVDLSKQTVDATQVVAQAEKALSDQGKVTAAVDARINRQYGREVSVQTRDGGRLTRALFFIDGRLIRLVANALPPNAQDRSGDALRFQQSLQFIDRTTAAAAISPIQPGGPGGGPGGGGRGGGRRFGRGGGLGALAQSACAGKTAGDKVQLDTPQGQVNATCTLVARPDRPPGDGGPAT